MMQDRNVVTANHYRIRTAPFPTMLSDLQRSFTDDDLTDIARRLVPLR